jgi:hypothetical protein
MQLVSTVFGVDVPPPDFRPPSDTALRNESASGSSWKLALALIALALIAAMIVLIATG